LAKLPVDVVGVGPKDLARGAAELAEVAAGRVDLVSANLSVAGGGKAPWSRVSLAEAGGVTFAVTGVMGRSVFEGLPADARGGLQWAEPAGAVRSVSDSVGPGPILVVLAASSREEVERITGLVDGVDVVVKLAGEGDKPRAPSRSRGTIVAETWPLAGRVGWMELVVEGGRIESFEFNFRRLDPSVPKREDMLALYERYAEDARRAILGDLAEPRTDYSANSSCAGAGCHGEIYVEWRRSKHGHAFETLVDAGRADHPECLSCHTVGFGERGGFRNMEVTPGLADVGCQSCHYLARDHDPEAVEKMEDLRARCLECHTQLRSPSFQWDEYLRNMGHCVDGEDDKGS
jgi:hypothetical protein